MLRRDSISSTGARLAAGAGLLALGALEGCALVLDFDYHAVGSTTTGMSTSTGGGGVAQGGGGSGGGVAQGGGGSGGVAQGGGGGGTCLDTMSDPLNCGKCGWSCLGGACEKGECQEVEVAVGMQLMSDNYVRLIADEKKIYWVNNMKGVTDILSVDKDTSPLPATPTPIVAGAKAAALAVDADTLYWTEPSLGRIVSSSKTKPLSPSTVLVTQEFSPVGLLVEGTSLFWATLMQAGEIRSMTTLGANVGSVQAGEVFPFRLAYEGKDLYWTYLGSTGTDGGVKKMQGGLQLLRIAENELIPSGLTVDTTHVYWVCSDGSVHRALRAGSVMVPPASELVALPKLGVMNFFGAIAVDDQFVYWTGEDVIWKALKDPAGAAKPTIFAFGPWIPADMIMAGDAIYWTTGSDRRLFRKVKPAPP